MYTQIIDFSCFVKNGDIARKYCIYNIKRGSEHQKHHGKSTQNRYKIDTGNKYVKSKGNVPKMDPNGNPNRPKIENI